jgi:uncharacterized protein (DUF2164 family)
MIVSPGSAYPKWWNRTEGVVSWFSGACPMIELSKQTRADAIASIQRYFQENMPEPIGDLAAGLLLNFFLEDIGPAIYNQAIADAQKRMQQRVSDLNGELYADEFQYWLKADAKRRNRR